MEVVSQQEQTDVVGKSVGFEVPADGLGTKGKMAQPPTWETRMEILAPQLHPDPGLAAVVIWESEPAHEKSASPSHLVTLSFK